MIPLHHPDTDATHECVSENEAAALRLHGWVDIDDEPDDGPAVHVGGGWYQLTDGTRVRGNPND